MKRIVFCWEMGGNYGHITAFIGLYNALVKQGCHVSFILADTQYAHLLPTSAQRNVYEAPKVTTVYDKRSGYSYADILPMYGYLDQNTLKRTVSEWHEQLKNLKADLVIVDHAPTALLAAQLNTIPSVTIGTGFVNPPLTSPFPLFDQQLPSPEPELENDILAVINAVFVEYNKPALTTLSGIFSASEQFICSFPELDHYSNRLDADYWGPLFYDAMGAQYSWPSSSVNTFAYLTAKIPNLSQLLKAISTLPGHKLVHIPNVDVHIKQLFNSPDLQISDKPFHLASLLKNADMVISQGGVGMVSICALAGVKHVLLPTQQEQHMLAKKLSAQGLVYAINPNSEKPDYENRLKQALNDKQLSQNALLYQQRYAGFNSDEQLEAMAEEIIEICHEHIS